MNTTGGIDRACRRSGDENLVVNIDVFNVVQRRISSVDQSIHAPFSPLHLPWRAQSWLARASAGALHACGGLFSSSTGVPLRFVRALSAAALACFRDVRPEP